MTPDIYIAERASHDERVAAIVRIADAILTDKPDLELASLTAEILRASVGVGAYAMPQPQARDPANRPYVGRKLVRDVA